MHSLTHFYNWSFSQVRTTYSMKWDGDMVLTREGIGYLADLSWQLEDSGAVVAIPRHPLSIVSESEAWIDLGYKFLEPWVYPMGPEFTFVKAFEWEVREFPDTSERIVAARGAVRGAEVARRRRVRALEHVRATSTGRGRRARPASGTSTPRSPEGRGEEVPGLERIEAPPGVHVIDHVATSWLPRAERPLVRRLPSLGARRSVSDLPGAGPRVPGPGRRADCVSSRLGHAGPA